MKYLIIHGSFGTPTGNWYPFLKEKLEILNQDVLVPQFPIEDWDYVTKQGKTYVNKKQTLDSWLHTFETKVSPWAKDEPVVVVAHSLGAVFLLHVLTNFELNVDTAIFVSPFFSVDDTIGPWQVQLVNKTFYKRDFNFEELRAKLPVSYVLYSENDPYVDPVNAREFAWELNSSVILVRGAEHMNSEVNMKEFPLVLELAKSRIDLTLYQK